MIRRPHRGQQAVSVYLVPPSFPPSSDSGGPAVPRGVPPRPRPPSPRNINRLPCTLDQLICEHTCTTTSQKAVSMGPRRSLGRPKYVFYDLGIEFGLILGSFFHQFFDIIRKWRKCEISEEYNAKRASEPSKTFDSRFEFSSTFFVFSKYHPKRVFFAFWPPEGAKKSPY